MINMSRALLLLVVGKKIGLTRNDEFCEFDHIWRAEMINMSRALLLLVLGKKIGLTRNNEFSEFDHFGNAEMELGTRAQVRGHFNEITRFQ